MREIKFRAWTQRDKTMHRPLDIREIMKVGWVSKDCILMQYTGLLDKNGVEIYEGSLVKGTYWIANKKPGFAALGESSFIETEFIVPVVFNEEEARFIFYPPQQYYWETDGLVDRWKEVVVAGDIYQNPELLKD